MYFGSLPRRTIVGLPGGRLIAALDAENQIVALRLVSDGQESLDGSILRQTDGLHAGAGGWWIADAIRRPFSPPNGGSQSGA